MAASETTPGGTPQDDLDAPSPPGGPLRSDAPDGPVPPGGPGTPAMPGEPEEVQRPDRPVTEPGNETEEPSPVLTGEDNAQTSQGEPSDDAGHE